MDERLTGHVEPYRRGGRDIRGRWRLVVNLSPVPIFGDDGAQARDGSGRLRWRYPKAERLVSVDRRRDADRELAAYLEELERERTRDGSRLTLADLADRWRRDGWHELRSKSRKFYGDNLRLHVLPALGAELAADVQPSDLTRLYAALEQRGLGPSSRRHVHATVHALYAWSIREELLERNPCRRIPRAKRPQQARAELEVWDQETIARALALSAGDPAAKDHRRRLPLLVHVPLALAAYAGLRDGEVCGLRWPELEIRAPATIAVRRKIVHVDGELVIEDPKSAAGERVIPIPPALVEILEAHRRRQDAFRLAHRRRWNPAGYVCATTAGLPMSPDNLSSAWRRFVKTRKLPALTFHGLRHAYATDLFDSAGGAPESMLKIVQERLGHADPATTARIYLHATELAHAAATARQQERIEAARAALERDPAAISRTIRERVSSLEAYRRRKAPAK